jgi:hypothetical protein
MIDAAQLKARTIEDTLSVDGHTSLIKAAWDETLRVLNEQ